MRPPRPSRGLPTSRAYWELKAEQMMNRVFSPEAAIDLDPSPADGERQQASAPHRPMPPAGGAGPKGMLPTAQAPGGGAKINKAPPPLTVLLLAALGGLGLVGALSAVFLVRQWTGLQQALSQERNLMLVERLRTLGPATHPTPPPITSTTPPAPVLEAIPSALSGHAGSTPVAEDLPPPPPEEPWMAQLSELPPTQGRAPLLRVPVSPRLMAVAPAASPAASPERASRERPRAGTPAQSRRPSVPLPQLVGLVGAPGRAGSAIFQMGDTSTNVTVGEPIGSSGWSLRAADADSALIERGTEVRRITIVSGS